APAAVRRVPSGWAKTRLPRFVEQLPPPQIRVLALDHALRRPPQQRLHRTAGVRIDAAPGARVIAAFAPRPRIAEPERREQIERSGFRPPVRDADPDADILRTALGVLHLNVEVPVALEHTRVDQLELRGVPVPSAVLAHEPRVRKLRLRILVQI